MSGRLAWHLAVGGGCMLAALVALALTTPARPSHAAEPHAHAPSGPTATALDTYEGARAELLARTVAAEGLAAGSPESWSRHADAAGYRLDYAQLTGDYQAYAAAEAHLERAFAAVERRGIPSAATKTGPFLLRAQLGYALHRLPSTLDDLAGPEHDARETGDRKLLAEVLALRGAATVARGDYAAGVALLREAERTDPNPSHRQRLALALAKLGEDDEALARLATPEGTSPRATAWLALQRALIHLERGRRAEARVELQAAATAFPGYWLVDEHLAELDQAEGNVGAAAATYRSLVARTSDPEFMDALARLVAHDAPDEAGELRRKSHALYMRRLAQFPEASYGHALEHALHEVADPGFAVDLAEKNRALRPNGEALTRLAQAYHRAGRYEDAARVMRSVLASAWVSAESFATAALVFERAGDRAAGIEAARRADARAPSARRELDWLERASPAAAQ